MGSINKTYAWSGIIMVIVMGISFVSLNQFMPPHSPALSANEIAAIYQERANPIRFGSVLIMLFSVLYVTWSLSIDEVLSRIEGVNKLLLSSQVLGAVLGCAFLLLSVILFGVTAFRPDRPPELTLLLSDLAWLVLVTPSGPFILQTASLGAAVLTDRSETPVLPRWLGYLTLWVSASTVPALVAFFFKTGPFAWDGIFPFWLPFILFSFWILLMSGFIIRAQSTAQ